MALLTSANWPRGRQLAPTFVAGPLVQAVQVLRVYPGLRMGVPAATTALVISCTPMLTAVVAARVFHVRIGLRQAAALVLGFGACRLGAVARSGPVARTAVEERAGGG
ncbi:hypothetical protein [Lentzea sp. NBRC 102530]|uniref:hypothetical protein n=1 Tax=Lentzea sp. NBRC 102530 TaxID=3032201 RepID=UPI0024A45886|nr:hypothetical protein [Lentzea sp. NBRC 102530]GLY52669.1 hypothetical protein Lesp01_63250 [Lentzea sp. NBRC 102530]